MIRAQTRLVADEAMFYAIVPGADRRGGSRRPAGLVVSLSRIIGGETCDRLDVTLMDVSPNGIGLRSPVPLDRGGIYKLDLRAADSIYIRINRSRRRFDDTYDVGARCM